MPSKYRPQIIGWIDDLDKIADIWKLHYGRFIYANNNYCAFIRKTFSDQIFYTCLTFVCIIGMIFSIVIMVMFIFGFDHKLTLIGIIGFITCSFALYLIIPEFYQNAFSRRGSPIIFNRQTGKVYVNESYFFNFKVRRHPKLFLQPKKRRIQEYDWHDMHGVIVYNGARLFATVLMVCQPGTYQVIDHVMLDPVRDSIGRKFIWGWLNGFMKFYESANIDDGKYKTAEEAKFKKDMIEGDGWPEWMVEAFNATSLEELAVIKQKYNINP
ncbi:DUF6708 domain-containing protein [Gilliamella sp. A7]|uniref:DUF6708 domain-containing protein n=1 Tax=Gilliamella sp. A7 TaxID=1970465 RepID=UPI000A33997C|nr:DUF6708 domain-containing protein [Gilliamella sp. A7]OTQ56245.1 hypothetical protein B6D18_11715 [Gilliamella sp. A7]